MPRKTLKEKRSRRPTEDNYNRVRNILQGLIGNEDSDDLMMEIMNTLPVSGFIPSAGSVYTFVYSAKTAQITYDQHPLVLVSGVFQWGFRGINFHWGNDDRATRNYNWDEVVGQLYEVRAAELSDMREIPYHKFINV